MSPITPEETLDSEVIYQGRVVHLRRDKVRSGTGKTVIREIVHHEPVVVMAPVLNDHELLMVRQYRKPIERDLLELPAGGVEPGETLEDAVRREMKEETGYETRRIEWLTSIYPTPGISDEFMHLFLVSDLHGDGVPTESADELEPVRMRISTAAEMARRGEILDAKSVIGVLMLESRGKHNDSGDGE